MPTFEECMRDFLSEYVRGWLDAHEADSCSAPSEDAVRGHRVVRLTFE